MDEDYDDEYLTVHNLTDSYINSSDRWRCKMFVEFTDEINRMASKSLPVMTSLYGLACGLGAFGNLLIILAIFTSVQLRILPNYFILNLAISDFFMCTFSAPFTLYMVQNMFWPFGGVGCRFIAGSQAINIFVSTLTLTGIGLHRYMLVKYPIKFQRNRVLPLLGIFTVWVVSVVLSCPFSLVAKALTLTEAYPNSRLIWTIPNAEFQHFLVQCGASEPEICIENPEGYIVPKEILSLSCFGLQYFFPLFTLMYLYCHVGSTAQERSNWRLQNLRVEDQEGRRQVQQNQRKTFLLLSSLVVAFAILWFPWNMYMTLTCFGVVPFSLTKVFAWVYLFGILQGIVNPILYGLLNENFRLVFVRLFQKVARNGRSTVDTRNARTRYSSLVQVNLTTV